MKKTKSSSFRGKTTSNAKQQTSQGSSYGYLKLPKGVPVFSPDPGSRVKLDFLPYMVTDKNHPDKDEDLEIAVPGSLWYKRPFKIHRNIGGGNDAVVCLTSINKKCPICEEKSKMTRNGADKSETDPLKATNRNLYIVIPLDSKKHDKEIHIFDMSQFLFQDLLNEDLEEDEDRGIFPDIEEGLTLKTRFDEDTFMKNKFAKVSRIDYVERDEAYDSSILDEVPNLDEVLKILTYEELKAKFFEIDDEEDGGELDDEDADEDAPSTRKKKSIAPSLRKTNKKFEEDADEDDDKEEPKKSNPSPFKSNVNPSGRKPVEKDENPDDNEDEDKPPVRKPATPVKRKSPVTVVHDDDDDDDDDAPPQRRVRK
jgi:hypothetical protein